jgi:hypothetical protein
VGRAWPSSQKPTKVGALRAFLKDLPAVPAADPFFAMPADLQSRHFGSPKRQPNPVPATSEAEVPAVRNTLRLRAFLHSSTPWTKSGHAFA